MRSSAIHVLVADDHPIVRDGLVDAVSRTQHMELVAAAKDFRSVLHVLQHKSVDVLVLDLGGLGTPPIMMIEQLRRTYHYLKIVVYSSSIDLVPEMLRAGARGYVAKEELTHQVLVAITAVYAGQTFLSPIVQAYMDQCNTRSTTYHLTSQELSIVKLLAHGLPTIAIADQLAIGPRTVHNHLYNARKKIGCAGQVELIHWYRRTYEVLDAAESISN